MKPHEVIETEDGHAVLVSVDTCERLKLRRHKWRMGTLRYPYVWLGVAMLMHRMILGATKGQIVDHINGDPLDNRDENLRLCTQAQNCQNQKAGRKGQPNGYKGVSWDSGSKRWMAAICVNRVRYYVGHYAHQERAAQAYDRAALALSGEFAALNFEPLRRSYKPRAPRLPVPRRAKASTP